MTKNFIDELSDLAHKLNGDARAIIGALEGGELSRWRSSNTESLSDYFEANGYLAADTPLSNRDLRVRVMSAVADHLNAGCIDLPAIDRIIGALPARSVSGNAEPTDTTLID